MCRMESLIQSEIPKASVNTGVFRRNGGNDSFVRIVEDFFWEL